MIVELCTDGISDYEQLQTLGIVRIELCSALEIGGLTPCYSLLKETRTNFTGEIFAMVRPRGGDFSYSPKEMDRMRMDMQIMSELGIDGVVFGLLNKNYQIDQQNNEKLLSIAHKLGLKTTFHRAIDLTENPLDSAILINKLGFDFILSSGGCPKAIEGKKQLKEINESIDNRTQLIVGSGINEHQIEEWISLGITGFHFTAFQKKDSIPLQMGSNTSFDSVKIKSILKIIKEHE